MKKISKIKRNEIYKLTLKLYNNRLAKETGVCLQLEFALEKLGGNKELNIFETLEVFPELKPYKPHSDKYFGTAYWFPMNESGYSARVKMLESIIRATS